MTYLLDEISELELLDKSFGQLFLPEKLEDRITRLTMCDLNNRRSKDGVNIVNHSKYSCQSELYKEEIIQVFMILNNLITKLSIEKDRFGNSKLLISQNELNELEKNMRITYKIINQLNNLINIEKSRLSTIKNTVKDKRKRDEFIKKINWMKNSINSASERYNEIGKFLDLPKGDLFTEIKKQTKPFQLDYISKKRKQEIERTLKIKEAKLIITDLRTPVELLKSRIVDHGIYPTYRLLRKNESEQKSIYQYSCSLFGLYVEGNGSSKYEAKENTAAKMLRSIIRKQKSLSLSFHIRGFDEQELKTLNPLIKSKTNYVNLLEKSCVKNEYPPPTYALLSHSKSYFDMEEYYSIQCEAMNLVAIGHSNNRFAAKQIAAHTVLKSWEENNLKKIPSK